MLARAAAASVRGLRPRARAVTHLAPSGEWLALDTSAAPDVDTVTVALGLSNGALDVIGDVRAIRWSATPGPHAAHAPVAELEWEGFTVRKCNAGEVAAWRLQGAAVPVRRLRVLTLPPHSAPRLMSCITRCGQTRWACGA